MVIAALFVAAAAFTYAALFHWEIPLLFVGLAWSVACLGPVFLSTRRWVRLVCFNVAAVIAVIAAGEVYLDTVQSGPERRQVFGHGEGVITDDVQLGHRPKPNFSTDSQLYYGDELVYDVVYTTDESGWRISPPAGDLDPKDCILFFGGSYTYGEGVNDDETMPWVVGTKLRNRYRVRNFGYAGYGPHHMLAQIEEGVVEEAAECDPKYAIYQAHPHHVLRASGKWWWDRYGPNYAFRPDGTVARDGSFSDRAAPSWLNNALESSPLAMQVRDNVRPDEDDVHLFHAIVRRSQQLLAERYPGIEFHVLYWDVGDPWLFTEPSMHEGIVVHRLSAVLPFDEPQWEEKLLLPHDVHPTAATHARIADYVVSEIVH